MEAARAPFQPLGPSPISRRARAPGTCGKLLEMNDKAASPSVKPLLQRLAEGAVVVDGAMGTMLYARGVFVNRCFDELNLSNPGLVRSIHQEYVAAGAEIIEANTFGAHRFKLGPHGLAPHVKKINREGVRLAREAAAGQALVAGAIGPVGKPLAPLGSIDPGEAVEAYTEQVEGLLEGGVDLVLIETMPSLDQARAALEAVRSRASALPVGVSLTFNEDGNTLFRPSSRRQLASVLGGGAETVASRPLTRN